MSFTVKRNSGIEVFMEEVDRYSVLNEQGDEVFGCQQRWMAEEFAAQGKIYQYWIKNKESVA